MDTTLLDTLRENVENSGKQATEKSRMKSQNHRYPAIGHTGSTELPMYKF